MKKHIEKKLILNESEEKLTLIFREVEKGNSDKMNENHVTEVLDQRRKLH